MHGITKVEALIRGRKPATRLFWLALAATLFLYCVNPTDYAFFPQCPLHKLTGWQCAGCGTLRAVHALTHGDLQTAFYLNPLFMIAAPFILLGFVRELHLEHRGERTNWNMVPATAIWGILVVLVTYGVLRNLI